MSPPSKITTDLQPDPAWASTARSFFADDRAFLDNQIRGCQQHLATGLLNGVVATYIKVDAGSAALTEGDVVCLAGSSLGYPTVTLATSTPLAAAGAAYGVVLRAASPGAFALIALAGVVPPSITGLAATSGLARVLANRAQRVASFGSSDYPLGTIDAAGYLALNPGVLVSSTGLVGTSAATPNTTVARGASAESAFGYVTATSYFQVGSSAKRFQDAAPSAIGHVSPDANGRLQVYVSGAASVIPVFADLSTAYAWNKEAADAGPAVATPEQHLAGQYAQQVTSATAILYPNDALLASDTDAATINVYYRFGSGSRTLVAHATTTLTGSAATGDWVAFDPIPMTMDLTTIPAAAKLTVEIAKDIGGGIIVPSFQLEIGGSRTA